MSLQYVIEKIENGVATIRYDDNSWAEIVIEEGMTEEDIDQEAWNFRPKKGVDSGVVAVGQARRASMAQRKNLLPSWMTNRMDAYGTLESQIEFITENGLEAWQAEVAAIKKRFPKDRT
jgi:hypothetical protein